MATEDGGGVNCYEWNVLKNNEILRNSAHRGGGVWTWEDYPATIINNVIRENFAEDAGGGIGVLWDYQTIIAGNLIVGNETYGDGAAIWMQSDPALIVNNTIVSNQSADGVGGIYGGYYGTASTIANCVFWDNGDDLEQCTATFSCLAVDDPGEGNIHESPQFVGAGGGDYRLLADSPCIDAGGNLLIPPQLTTDLDDHPRIAAGVVDMGAYEFEYPGPRIIYVDGDASGGDDGTSWANAFRDLQDALGIADVGDEIRVAEGVYTPTDPGGSREATFQLLSGVTLRGGYAGFGTAFPDARDPAAFDSILSGDLSRNDAAEFTNYEDNVYHVVTGSGVDETALLDGFSIAGGHADGEGTQGFGGGLYDGSPTVVDCYLAGNQAVYGGGMCAAATVIDCVFFDNKAEYGGGLRDLSVGDGSPTVVDSRFYQNRAEYGGGAFISRYSTFEDCGFDENAAIHGGGMFVDERDPTLSGCTFFGNTATQDGGGLSVANGSPTLSDCLFEVNVAGIDPRNSGQGGGIFINAGAVTLVDCTFDNNTGIYGAAVLADNAQVAATRSLFRNHATVAISAQYDSNITSLDCTFLANTRVFECYGGDVSVTNSLFSGNHRVAFFDWCDSILTNCTINASQGVFGLDGGSVTTLNNCIVWDCDTLEYNGDGELLIRNSCVEGWSGGVGNINADPLFVDADGPDNLVGTADDNLRLRANSSCINGGDNTALPPGVATDLDGNARIVGVTVDMGAYEFEYPGPRMIYVDVDATGSNDGTSWANAFRDLQDALAIAGPGSEIRVAQGVYTPQSGDKTPIFDRNATLQLRNGVTVRGGYAGFGEIDPDARDVQAYPTVLSGDLTGNDGANFGGNEENCYHVVTGTGTNPSAVLDGFVVTAGNANGPDVDGEWVPVQHGGGLYNGSGSPTVIDCVFVGNSAIGDGGGVYNYQGSNPTFVGCDFTANAAQGMANWFGSSPTLTDCSFTANTNGGMQNFDACNPVLVDCRFTANRAESGFGGGMQNQRGSRPTLDDCVFEANFSSQRGGALYLADHSNAVLNNCTFYANQATWFGGAVSSEVSSPTFNNCTFRDNEAVDGGAVANWSQISYVGVESGVAFAGCLFDGNVAQRYGGAISVDCSISSSLDVANCTFAGNVATAGRGISVDSFMQRSPADVQIANSIFADGNSEIRNNDNSLVVIYYSNVPGVWPGGGNIDTDPLFVDAAGGNYRLLANSPCVNAGDNEAVPPTMTTDLDGNPRIVGDRVDMGAYELQPTPVPSVLYVDDSADGANDGTSWQDAFTDLQDALAVAIDGEVREVRVAQGMYRPAGPGGDREASFRPVSDVAVRGGYAGVAGADPDARDVSVYETILSGDLNGDDLDLGGNGENSYHVVAGGGESAVLDGLTIAGGNADGRLFYPESFGGGMYEFAGTASNCVIRDNAAVNGGGLYQPSGQFVQCVIADNMATQRGGGAFFDGDRPTFTQLRSSAATWRNPTATTAAAAASYPGQRPGSDQLRLCRQLGTHWRRGGLRGELRQRGRQLRLCRQSGHRKRRAAFTTIRRHRRYALADQLHLLGEFADGRIDEAAQIAGETLTIDYSCVQGLTGELGGAGNIGSDPRFVDADGPDNLFGTADDNLRLLPGSPCVNTGDNAAVPPTRDDRSGRQSADHRRPSGHGGLRTPADTGAKRTPCRRQRRRRQRRHELARRLHRPARRPGGGHRRGGARNPGGPGRVSPGRTGRRPRG